ncbi:hypothetical protein MANES_03G012550v8 [Manihot esculenta]|uniref:Uncharacterized protein n=1 Tax=Manihot esculenta TaxID=3983 RepID=A0ACB7HVL2_MANES|nr:hypothetical protein MANES_03G012550v8 [Manihot esculenta]
MQYDSLNWQHPFCGKSRQNPEIITLFVDYICPNPSDRHFQLAAINQLIGSPPKTEGSFLMVVHGHQTFQPTSAPLQAPSPTWMSNPASATHPIVSGGIASMPKGLGDSDASGTRISEVPERNNGMALGGSWIEMKSPLITQISFSSSHKNLGLLGSSCEV